MASATVRYRGRQGCGVSIIIIIVAAFVLVAISDVTGASSDFYYDNWQCNNYLSAESLLVQAPAGQLLEIHIRDDIPVSIRNTRNPDISPGLFTPRTFLPRLPPLSK